MGIPMTMLGCCSILLKPRYRLHMPILQVRLTSIKEMYFLGNGGVGIYSQGFGASDLHSFSAHSAE